MDEHTKGILGIKEDAEMGELICYLGITSRDVRTYFDVIAKIYPSVHGGGQEANAKRFRDIWNTADGIPTDEAVKRIEHYEEMSNQYELSKLYCEMIEKENEQMKQILELAEKANTVTAAAHVINEATELLAKLNAK